jgi:glycosyltransferase involved in cell wall biosynthesis
MRLAFQHFVDKAWDAGDWFLEGLLISLRRLETTCPKLVLMVSESAEESAYQSLAALADEVVRTPVQAADESMRMQQSLRYHLSWWARHRLLRVPAPKTAHPFNAVLTRHQIDAYFTMAANTAPQTTTPSLVWIPDFQHRRLPSNFAPAERAKRDRAFAVQARCAARLITTSAEVLRDLRNFAPDEAAKGRAIQFVANVPADVYEPDPLAGLARYHLPEKFVYLPNQFWRHKNHKLVFEALSRLQARAVRPIIVSSGSPTDYRWPAHFSDLMQLLSEANLRDQFIYLGRVPRTDLFLLMRQAICVLNPSLFEGLGMSVAESKSLGKRVLASDLEPIREQSAPGAEYFDPQDADNLAAKLEAAWMNLRAGPDHEMEAAARTALPGRQRAFGAAFLQLANEAIQSWPAAWMPPSPNRRPL